MKRARHDDKNGFVCSSKAKRPRRVLRNPEAGPVVDLLPELRVHALYPVLDLQTLGRLARTCRFFRREISQLPSSANWLPSKWREIMYWVRHKDRWNEVVNFISRLRKAGFFHLPGIGECSSLYLYNPLSVWVEKSAGGRRVFSTGFFPFLPESELSRRVAALALDIHAHAKCVERDEIESRIRNTDPVYLDFSRREGGSLAAMGELRRRQEKFAQLLFATNDDGTPKWTDLATFAATHADEHARLLARCLELEAELDLCRNGRRTHFDARLAEELAKAGLTAV